MPRLLLRPLLPPPLPGWRAALLVLAYIAGYTALDEVSYIIPVLPLGISPWNPPPGLTLFVLIVFGLRYAPAVTVACMVSEYVVRGLPTPWPMLLASLWITLVYSLCAHVLRGHLTDGGRVDSLTDFGWFLGATFVSTLTVAAGYVGIFTLAGALVWADFGSHFIRFWIGDADGILVVTTLLLTLRGWRPSWPGWRVAGELLAQGLSLGLSIWFVFREPNLQQFQFFYLLFLPVLWIVVRHGLRGAVIALAVTQIGLIAVVPETELFATAFIRYQFLLLSLCLTALVMGTLTLQRARADAALHEKNALLARTLQMAAAGELSSALSHELNQPIAAASNYLSACRLLMEQPELPRERLDDALTRADQEVRRAAGVVRKLRDFFQQGTVERDAIDVRDLLQRVERRLAPRASRLDVSIDLRTPPELPHLQADAVQLELILNNLLINALDAYEESGLTRGQVIVAVQPAESGEAERDPGLRLSIDDDGPGIPAELGDRLFEPFTTSKSGGMGLGLAISRTLAEANGGRLDYRRSTRGGSRFELTLPIA